MQPLGLVQLQVCRALRSLRADLRQADSLFQYLLDLLLLLLSQSTSLRVGQLSQPFITDLSPTQPFEDTCCTFLGPETTPQRSKISQDRRNIVSLPQPSNPLPCEPDGDTADSIAASGALSCGQNSSGAPTGSFLTFASARFRRPGTFSVVLRPSNSLLERFFHRVSSWI